MEDPPQPTDNNHLTVSGDHTRDDSAPPKNQPSNFMVLLSSEQISAPFEFAITMREEDFEDYGAALQEIIQRLAGNTETAGLPNSSVLYIKKSSAPFNQHL